MEREEIDAERWDETIARSSPETLYPYSWYLDSSAGRWSALLTGDYRMVMPLPWKRKLGIRYLYHPLYTQQLGVFSDGYVDPLVISHLLREVYRRYRLGGLQFNTANLVGEQEGFRVKDRANFVLPLDRSYAEIAEDYSQNTRRNLKRAGEMDDRLERELDCSELVNFKRRYDVIRRSENDYRWLTAHLEEILHRKQGKIYALRRGDEILAAAFFGFSRSRALYLVSASSEAGKERRSMFRIIDTFIRDHAGSSLQLDFEGSDIPSLARFFRGFGAQSRTYQQVLFNRMPRMIRKLQGYG